MRKGTSTPLTSGARPSTRASVRATPGTSPSTGPAASARRTRGNVTVSPMVEPTAAAAAMAALPPRARRRRACGRKRWRQRHRVGGDNRRGERKSGNGPQHEKEDSKRGTRVSKVRPSPATVPKGVHLEVVPAARADEVRPACPRQPPSHPPHGPVRQNLPAAQQRAFRELTCQHWWHRPGPVHP